MEVKAGMSRFLALFDAVAAHDSAFYNDDDRLGTSVLDAVALSNMLQVWPAGLKALADKRGTTLEEVGDTLRLEVADRAAAEEVHGLIALAWIKEASSVVLDGTILSPESVVSIARALPPSLTALSLGKCDIAKDGKDLKGVERIVMALPSSKLQLLNLASNYLPPDAGKLIGDGLKATASLTSLE